MASHAIEQKNMAKPPSWIKGALLLREGGYRKGREGEREGRQGEEEERRVREGRKGGEGTHVCIFKFSL